MWFIVGKYRGYRRIGVRRRWFPDLVQVSFKWDYFAKVDVEDRKGERLPRCP